MLNVGKNGMVPKILHYCFGLSADFGRRPWSLVHYVCLKSAFERLKPAETVLHCQFEPSGPWWEITRPMVTVDKVAAPREIFGNPLLHTAHRADVLRLEVLLSSGGIYLDADVFVHRSFDDLLSHSTVLGEQRAQGGVPGICNAVILAQPEAPFLRRWREEYRSFRSKGRDALWDEHSVRIPYALSRQFPDEVTTLPESAFFWPPPTRRGLADIFDSKKDLNMSASYATHLWESMAWERHLLGLTPGRVRRTDSNFHRWARPTLNGLPDNFAAPALTVRARRKLHAIRRSLPPPRKSVSYLAYSICRTAVRLHPQSSLGRFYRQHVFCDIYEQGLWGRHGESKYFSGVGSLGKAARAYVHSIAATVAALAKGGEITLVDLGCGDFRIGADLLKRLPSVRYLGCDIVPGLIEENQRNHKSDRVAFRHLDIVSEKLPAGDVYLVRQVLQHLSNSEIKAVVDKLRACPHVFITEGQPAILEGPVNPDKRVSAGVRFDWRRGRGRGVELASPPFNVPVQEVFRVAQDEEGTKEILVTWRL